MAQQYIFNGAYGVYGTSTGVFVINNIPSQHPIAFLNSGKESLIEYQGQFNAGSKTGLDGNTYNFFYGDVTLSVSGDYGTISYQCFYHGYMGGQNNLVYDLASCPSQTPSVEPLPGDPVENYTLSYSDGAKGWPSFYSFFPDFMMGMNNYFYSFKGGALYRHNTNSLRNNYYGVQYNSQITSVFNEAALETKLFKTINLESDTSWSATLDSDIQTGATVDYSWFEQKEGSWFAYVRNNGTSPASASEYPMRSVSGIARSSSVNANGNFTTINFSINPLIEIGNILSVGDMLYYSLPSYTTVQLGGQVSAINIDIVNGINNIVINTSIANAVTPIPIQDAFIMFIKNQQAESNGLLGHYCLFTLTNSDSTPTELFAVESEVMKSNP